LALAPQAAARSARDWSGCTSGGGARSSGGRARLAALMRWTPPATKLLATDANEPGSDTHDSRQDRPGAFDPRVMFAPRRRSYPERQAEAPRWIRGRTEGPDEQEGRPRSRDAGPEHTAPTRRPSDRDPPECVRRWRRMGWSELPRMRRHSPARRREAPQPEQTAGWGRQVRNGPRQGRPPRTSRGREPTIRESRAPRRRGPRRAQAPDASVSWPTQIEREMYWWCLLLLGGPTVLHRVAPNMHLFTECWKSK